ncbi:MAG: hypothetical protein Q9218_004488 [Villophora microphyllina]
MKDTYDKYAADLGGNVGREFTLQDIKNGWTMKTEDRNPDFGMKWAGAFKEISGDEQTPLLDMKTIKWTQDLEFKTDSGLTVPVCLPLLLSIGGHFSPQALQINRFSGQRHTNKCWGQAASATQAFAICAYSFATSLIIAVDTESPTYKLKKRNPGITTAELEHQKPPLNRFSDLMWTVWRDLTGNIQNARKLRYIGRSIIINEDSRYIMKAIFFAAKQSKNVPWPGLRYNMHQQQGQALLATPNGLATVRLLIDHHAILGARDLLVTIWTVPLFRVNPDKPDDDEFDDFNIQYFMLWDMGDPNKMPDFSRPPRLTH